MKSFIYSYNLCTLPKRTDMPFRESYWDKDTKQLDWRRCHLGPDINSMGKLSCLCKLNGCLWEGHFDWEIKKGVEAIIPDRFFTFLVGRTVCLRLSTYMYIIWFDVRTVNINWLFNHLNFILNVSFQDFCALWDI